MNPQDQQLPKIKCSAKSLGQTRNSCAQKELQSHGVEDGSNPATCPLRTTICAFLIAHGDNFRHNDLSGAGVGCTLVLRIETIAI
jgi:hypothetical protein